MKSTLVSRDSKGKFRVIYQELLYDDSNKIYIIKRSSGVFNGKLIEQPEIIINKGKVKRTIEEQANLEYNSLIKKQLDKGYKLIELETFDEKDLETFLPKQNTDQNGISKPQLCKVFDKTDNKLINKEWLASYKLDGVRCFLFYKDGEIKTKSRGGQNYDIPTTYIRTDPTIIKFFEVNSELILDGEIYRHGWSLNKISGLCRKETLEEEHKELKFYCYDIADESLKFKDRYVGLNAIKDLTENSDKIVIIPHYKVSNLNEIMNLHNQAISQGYEGLVVRDPDKEYKFGSRDNRMCKIKEFQDAEFEILGISEGLRDEDMCFILKTKEGYEFKAKPIGTREDKQWYREHITELIGKFGTVKYFGFTNTEKPVPNLPVFKYVRYGDDK